LSSKSVKKWKREIRFLLSSKSVKK
jgi:hypothetical protein